MSLLQEMIKGIDFSMLIEEDTDWAAVFVHNDMCGTFKERVCCAVSLTIASTVP